MRERGMTACVLMGMVLSIGMSSSALVAESSGAPAVVEQIGSTATKVGKKIEEGVTKTVKKVEEKHFGDKIEQKLRKAANKTAEGFEKAGKEIELKFGN